jgi:hypothetical protein
MKCSKRQGIQFNFKKKNLFFLEKKIFFIRARRKNKKNFITKKQKGLGKPS